MKLNNNINDLPSKLSLLNILGNACENISEIH